ncbi:hypothetical protein BD560DRAFT_491412 [Blakeslea trispora]|nr:hypothetical protein BD560DRAFT_491412 [Blakeslea trispora]
MKVVYAEDGLLHNPPVEVTAGKIKSYVESPKRLEYIKQALDAHGKFQIVDPNDYSLAPILDVHGKDYIQFLELIYQEWTEAGLPKDICIGDTFATHGFLGRIDPQIAKQNALKTPNGKLGYFVGDMSIGFMKDTWRSAYASAQVVLTAAHYLAEMTASGGDQSVYALCRPPGHHASHEMSAGYCFINNAAVAARFLQNYTLKDMHEIKKPYEAHASLRRDSIPHNPSMNNKRVLIIDIDYHHGNGTQDIFYDDPTVFYVSIHGSPDYPFISGSKEETGQGAGQGYTLNIPLDSKIITDEIYLHHLENALEDERVVQFKADFVIVSMGLDTWHEDPIAGMKELKDQTTYRKMGKLLKVARSTQQRPTLFVQEGGYTLDMLGSLAIQVLEGYCEA